MDIFNTDNIDESYDKIGFNEFLVGGSLCFMDNMIDVAIVLAGGKGSRLRKVVNDVPKPLAKINGRPFLEYLFAFLPPLLSATKGQNL